MTIEKFVAKKANIQVEENNNDQNNNNEPKMDEDDDKLVEELMDFLKNV